MIQKFEITGVHVEINQQLREYIIKKLGSIDRYLPRHSRDSAHLEVRLNESKIDGKIQTICEVTLYMPHDTINLTESANTIYGAVDITKTKLKQRVQKYKDEHMNSKKRRHVFGRLRQRLSSKLPRRYQSP